MESKPGEPLSEEKVGADLRRIYGRGDFEGISYHISGDAGPRAMVIEPREKSWGPDYLRFGLGLASDFQGDNMFNVLVQYRKDLAEPPRRRVADRGPGRAEHASCSASSTSP